MRALSGKEEISLLAEQLDLLLLRGSLAPEEVPELELPPVPRKVVVVIVY